MPSREKGSRGWFLSWLESPGLSPRQERGLKATLVLLVLALGTGWTWIIADAARYDRALPTTDLTASPLSPDAAPPAAFVLDRLVRAVAEEPGWRGRSGAVR
ncbi:MAG TPA: hypothetical protein VK966_03985, partial [Longimicrobiales bacterium]|nr:hypothetical protein [Longimicrobiales bacterium]